MCMRKPRILTGVEGVRNGVEHVCVHVCVDSPVRRRRVVPRSDEDGVTLGYGDGDEVDGRLLNISL